MAFEKLDAPALARALAAVADRAEDHAEIFFESCEELELPPEGAAVGLRRRRDQGFAVRLLRDGRSWLASRDGIDGRGFVEALRQVARALPAALVEPALEPQGDLPGIDSAELLAFPALLERAIRSHHAAFPARVGVRILARDVAVVGARWSAPPERERFAALEIETPWGRRGALFPRLDAAAAAELGAALVGHFRARRAPSPAASRERLLLAPAATATLLHEAVAHALEADLLALAGRPEAARGVALGPAQLDVLDDPAAAPAGVARAYDDEGSPVVRRWLLRQGRVEQPLADVASARRSEHLLPGSGFRASRHAPPLPRTVHLEMPAGGATRAELVRAGEGGLWVPEVESGALDPASGAVRLEIPYARRLSGGEAGEACGRFAIVGRVADLLGAIVAIGDEAVAAGAGWCAKGGQRRPVWASAPAILLDGVAIAGSGG
ncbi:MAG: metallopeptidase TldD-related protein [Thermoanaerobaculia bacterium]